MQNKKSAEQVLSRRLRPIYDCIDVGQYKKAILEVDKVLKKHPNTHTAKALKALALIRTERAAEAMPILNSLEKTITEDEEYNENTMQALCHCYKELNNPQQIVALYSSVAKRFPTNDKLIRELFFAHVRTRNYRQQQQVAMQLYKEANLVQYYCWSVLSVLMQGQDNPRLGSTMFFPLAEKMLAKLTVEELYQMQGGLDLQLLVLESNGKFGQAIELLVSSPKYAEENYSEEQVKQMLDRFYKCQGDAHAWLARNQRAVEIDPNEWSNWTNLAESAIAIMKDRPPEECAGIAQRTAQHWRNTFDHFCAGDPSNLPASCRGLLLGRLLLLQKFLDANVQSSLLGSPLSACEELISAVGHKPFGFADLKPFTNLLDANDAQQLLDLVDQRRRQFKQQLKLDDSIWLTILWEQCHFHFHHPATLSDAQLREAVHRLVAHLVGGQEEINDENGNSGKDMDGVSRRPNGMQATALVQLMAQYVWEQYTRKEPGEEAPLNMLLALIAFMETIWADFEDCTASVPILLCRLYGIFGDIDRIKNLEREVQLKFLQKDSLAFLRFFVPGNFGKFKCANIYYTSLGSMYDVNEREANECLVGAYKNAAFHQIPKLVDFASRSANSIFSVGADILSRCISGCFAVGAEMAAGTLAGDGQNIDWDSVADNRDFSVLPIISSELLVAQMREHSFKEMKLYFKLKHSLITAIGHVGTGQLAQSVLQFQQTLEECRKEFPVDTSKSQECRLESFTNLRLDSLVNPDNFLFDLPQSVLSLALELAELRAKNPAEDMNNAAKKKACLAAVTFSPLLQKLADYYRVPDVATLEGRICALQRVSSALELIALSQIGHRLVEKMVAANASSSSSRPNSPAINNNGDIQQQQKQQVRRKTKNGERDKDNDKKAEKPQSQQMQKGVVVDLFAQSLLSMRAFLSEHFGSQNASIKGANINQQYGADQIFPESARQSIVRMQECVIASINGAHSVDELQEAIGHLLANYSSVRQ